MWKRMAQEQWQMPSRYALENSNLVIVCRSIRCLQQAFGKAREMASIIIKVVHQLEAMQLCQSPIASGFGG